MQSEEEDIKIQPIASYTYSIEPTTGNGQQELSLGELVRYLIDAATRHAEEWQVGYGDLILQNKAWVLARLTIAMKRPFKIRENLVIETWVEGYNKFFSSRNFCFKTDAGEICGYSRTIWSVIDLSTRQSVDLTTFRKFDSQIADRKCPIAPQVKLKPVTTGEKIGYTILPSDIDLNRHVNSAKQVELMTDLFPLEMYDKMQIKRFEIAYLNEAIYGEKLYRKIANVEPSVYTIETVNNEEKVINRCKIIFKNRI